MIKDLLPIGSVVLLKGAKKRLMIYGINQKTENGDVYDYLGCLYPEGNISVEYTYLFNKDAIESVYFLGFVDPEFSICRQKLQESMDKQDLKSEVSDTVKA